MERKYINITVGNTQLIQDEKGQTIIIDGVSSFMAWEVLEMTPQEIKQVMDARGNGLDAEANHIPSVREIAKREFDKHKEPIPSDILQWYTWKRAYDSAAHNLFPKIKWIPIDPNNIYKDGMVLAVNKNENNLMVGQLKKEKKEDFVYCLIPNTSIATVATHYIPVEQLLKLSEK